MRYGSVNGGIGGSGSSSCSNGGGVSSLVVLLSIKCLVVIVFVDAV